MNEGLIPVFQTLRALFSAHADKCFVVRDDPANYYLGTHEVRAKDGYRTGFGGVEIKKAYVSVHLMPVYVHPDMLEKMTPGLAKRMQGKSCFNFKKSDDRLFDELEQLIQNGVSRFQQDGRL